mmetsp:Transcript_25199/g.52322  ORF Transcript_25199/g.52322 Transcript_25199/m.52322 type:complete len:163 (+) Transcript_25199:338-826(+)
MPILRVTLLPLPSSRYAFTWTHEDRSPSPASTYPCDITLTAEDDEGRRWGDPLIVEKGHRPGVPFSIPDPEEAEASSSSSLPTRLRVLSIRPSSPSSSSSSPRPSSSQVVVGGLPAVVLASFVSLPFASGSCPCTFDYVRAYPCPLEGGGGGGGGGVRLRIG